MKNSYADGFVVGTGLTLLPRHHDESTVPMAKTAPMVAVGTRLPVPIALPVGLTEMGLEL
jgi:hypothetical protein